MLKLLQPVPQQKRIASAATVSTNADAVSSLNSTVTDLKTTNVGLAQTISDTKKQITDELESPLAIHYKGVTDHTGCLLRG